MRLERAFLLEQLARRTSTNVEDSDGSPSPPATVRATSPDPSSFPSSNINSKTNRRLANHSSPQPKEKPLRIKRGHRKSNLPADATPSGTKSGGPGASNLSFMDPASPSETAISQTRDGETTAADTQSQENTNGILKPPKKPGNAFELYCESVRPELMEKRKDDEGAAESNIEEELEKSWKDLPEKEKEDFENQATEALEKYQKEKEEYTAKTKDADKPAVKSEAGGATAEETPQATRDEDVEMANSDTDEETQGEKAEE